MGTPMWTSSGPSELSGDSGCVHSGRLPRLQHNTPQHRTHHGKLQCTQPHTPTTQHTLSARFVGKPCTGSCLPKEHGAVRPGSLGNTNNNNYHGLIIPGTSIDILHRLIACYY